MNDVSRRFPSGQPAGGPSIAARLEREVIAAQVAVATIESGLVAAGVAELKRVLPQISASLRAIRLRQGLEVVRGLR
jgi:hypothetical protein